MPRGVTRRAFLRRAALTTAGTMLATNAIGRIAGSPSLDLLAPVATAGHRARVGGIATPSIVTRAQWGADEGLRRDAPVFHPPRKVIVHHTAMAVTGDSAADVREIYRQHLVRDGGTWSDLGYHFLIDRHGTVFEGRWARDYAADAPHDGHDDFDRIARGAHAEGANRGTVGIALMGNFEGAVPTSAMSGALVDLIAWLVTRHGLDAEGAEPFVDDHGIRRALPTIVGHRDVKATACPGAVVHGMLPDVRRRVAKRVAARSYETGGYRIVHTDGTVTSRGPLAAALDRGVRAESPVAMVGGAASGAGGMWVADAIGGVHTLGDARFHGSIPRLRAEGVSIGSTRAAAIAASPGRGGYRVLDRDGGVFTFGDATFHGSIPRLRAAGHPIGDTQAVDLAPTPNGRGYWILDRDGGVFTFGDATFHGSIPRLRAAGHPIGDTQAVDLAPTPSGRGYWVLDRDGGVFTFGDATFHGSGPSAGHRGAPATAMSPAPDGAGYAILCEDGAVLTFGRATFCGHGPARAARDLVAVPGVAES